MIYKAVVNLQHISGEVVTVTIQGKNAKVTAAVANSIKDKYEETRALGSTPIREEDVSQREFWDFLRDFFDLRRRWAR